MKPSVMQLASAGHCRLCCIQSAPRHAAGGRPRQRERPYPPGGQAPLHYNAAASKKRCPRQFQRLCRVACSTTRCALHQGSICSCLPSLFKCRAAPVKLVTRKCTGVHAFTILVFQERVFLLTCPSVMYRDGASKIGGCWKKEHGCRPAICRASGIC